ncbi:MAG TPA: hypothetical protein ACFYD3_11705 [Candidatus Hypogeohydataceae bacterium YC41]
MNSESKYNPETVNAVLEVMRKELEAEEKRDDFVLNKTNTILTVSGILLAAISFLIHDFGGVLPRFMLLILVIGALCVFCSILVVLLLVLKVESFARIDFNVLLGELRHNPVEVKSRLIATYKEVLLKNSNLVKHRVQRLWYSIYFMIAGAVTIILV